MRFAKGNIPEDPSFDPAAGGWQAMREPSQQTVLVAASLLVLPLMIVFVVVWFLVGDLGNIDIDLRGTSVLAVLGWAGVFLGGIASLMMVHEFVHLGLAPGTLRTDRKLLVFKLPLALMAHYDGIMSRGRMLVVFAGPLVLLTVVPMILDSIPGVQLPLWLVFMLSFHGAACVGDMMGMTLVLLFVPWGAEVRNLGWKTYWRMPLSPAEGGAPVSE